MTLPNLNKSMRLADRVGSFKVWYMFVSQGGDAREIQADQRTI